MKCPHCGVETDAALPRCLACGEMIQEVGDSFFSVRPPSKKAASEGSPWTARLAGLLLLLVLVAVGLHLARGYIQRQPLSTADVGELEARVPEPKFPMPAPPKSLPQAPLLRSLSVALPSLPPLRLAFGSRDKRVRQLFLERNGGDKQSEDAVERGLKWLAEAQNKDTGAWDCGVHQGKAEFTLGVTGLALLAFLGAGHTHLGAPQYEGGDKNAPGAAESPYRETVAKAIQFILSQQNAQGQFPGRLYHHGICTMAIVEAYGMTGDTPLLPPSERAVAAIVAAQNESGGWDYNFVSERNRGDTSVTGWQVMALKSAKRVGIEFPEEVLAKARDFLKEITHDDGGVGYDNTGAWRTTPALTAAGLNADLIAEPDTDADDIQRAIGFLLRHPPVEPKAQGAGWSPNADIYLWYHGNLSLIRLGGQEWRFWNERLKPLLCHIQSKEGYWDTHGDTWGQYGGRIYFTALAILALEVYYRYD